MSAFNPGIDDHYRHMPDMVQIATKTGSNVYNEPTFGPDVSYRARVKYGQVRVYDTDGKETVASATVLLGTANEIPTDARVTLPTGAQPRIIGEPRIPNQNGPFYTMLYLGK